MSIDELNKKNGEKLKRKHHIALMLNDYEMQAVLKFCKKYKVKNRSKFMRETIVTAILNKFDEDYPTLFDPTLYEKKDIDSKAIETTK